MSVDDFLGGGFLEDDDDEDGEVLLIRLSFRDAQSDIFSADRWS